MPMWHGVMVVKELVEFCRTIRVLVATFGLRYAPPQARTPTARDVAGDWWMLRPLAYRYG